ncbi:MAG: outer membrane protein transport protein [Ignavibacteriales bacterium]|nr:MAG: hypothetical protein F9K26_02355 [Ignavibacteriaceae bacterium]MBW7872275.1 hypothetical protein [Ignavibacteria bacterium]MCZ2142557.1 outer membrane protein transport protein [Ignavibacteriales bacterium]OQY75244.1 MAG: hypothetical protein B6D45_05890 [Ignavibacteriales bacterium UTCHB3]MBV6445578.1 hypothetical protein [Ignavibacteriaceae bacterium]
MKKSILFLLVISFSSLYAQVNTSNSRFGVGTVIYGTTARDLSFGELGSALYETDRVNLMNPASFGSFNLTRADFGQVFEASFVKQSDASSYYAGGYFPGFSLGLPVSNAHGVGVVFGVNKYSDISFEGSRNGSINSGSSFVPDTYKEEYFYDGGITKVSLGASYRLPFGWNIGASADFLMGHIEYEASNKFNSSSVVDAVFTREHNFKGFSSTLGLLSDNLNKYFDISDLEDIRISFGYSIQSKLNGDYAVYTMNTTGSPDTLSKGNTEVTIPSRLFAGFSVKFNPRTKIYADFLTQSWKNFAITNSVSETLTNNFKISTGIEYNPQHGSSMFVDDLSYRFGLSYEKLPYLIGGESSYRMSAGAGVSIPLSTANYLDLGVQYSFNSGATPSSVKDHTVKLMVGLSVGELWFLRTEY